MSVVKNCYVITESLLKLLHHVDEHKRDDIIMQVEKLLDQRENLLPQIQKPFSKEDTMIGKKLLQLNKQLVLSLEKFNHQILRDLNGLKRKKVTASQYKNPYAATQMSDGAFYDKRQ